MRVLITGSTGQVGFELLRAFGPEVEIIAPDRASFDLANFDSIRNCINRAQPNAIINAAGYTSVDGAESEPELARRLNAEAVGVIGKEASKVGAAVVHYSTDYIFNGDKTTPYLPGDEPAPLNVYGRTKLQGENELIDSGADLLILRTCWVYGLRRRNFLKAILDGAARSKELNVVNDQFGGPTWCRVIAQSTAAILSKALVQEHGRNTFGESEGIYHLACGGQTTWHAFAERILQLADVQLVQPIKPISAAEYGAKAIRPRYSVLDCSTTIRQFGVRLPHWNDALEHAIAQAKTRAHKSEHDLTGVQT